MPFGPGHHGDHGEERGPGAFRGGSATAAAAEGSLATFTVSGSDPDGDAIGTLTATSRLAGGSGASFSAGPENTSGTFRWTPGFSDSRPDPYGVTFTASNALSVPRPPESR